MGALRPEMDTNTGGMDMDFFWFFVGLAMVIAVLGMLKVSTIND